MPLETPEGGGGGGTATDVFLERVGFVFTVFIFLVNSKNLQSWVPSNSTYEMVSLRMTLKSKYVGIKTINIFAIHKL